LKFYNEFISELTNQFYDYSRMSIILESEDNCVIDGIEIVRNKIATIQRYYESTNDFNRTKLTKMINNNVHNVDVVYELILTINGAK